MAEVKENNLVANELISDIAVGKVPREERIQDQLCLVGAGRAGGGHQEA